MESFGLDLPAEAKASGREEKLPCDQAWQFSPKGWGLCKLGTVLALSHLFGLMLTLSMRRDGWSRTKQGGHRGSPIASLTCLFVPSYTNLLPKYKFRHMVGRGKAIWKHLQQWITNGDFYKALILHYSKRKKTQSLGSTTKWVTFKRLPLAPTKSDGKGCFQCAFGICNWWEIVCGKLCPDLFCLINWTFGYKTAWFEACLQSYLSPSM